MALRWPQESLGFSLDQLNVHPEKECNDEDLFVKPVARHLMKLSCPECRGEFRFTEFPVSSMPDGEFGVLECSCFAYPVLDSVPIMLRDSVAQFSFGTGEIESDGPDVSEVVELIRRSQGVDALVQCLTFTPTYEILDKLPGWRLWHQGLVPRLTRRRIEKEVRRLISDVESNTAEDWLELYFTRHSGENRVLLDYYRHRFVLPRTLATYSLLELMPADETILDIACGLGPFGHYLANRPAASEVIGFDFNFYLAWWQRRFMAPRQLFMCADAAQNLPFKNDVFGGVYCSDSFMFIPNREQLLEECRRCAPNRPMAITRLGNRDAYPKRWGDELGAEEYPALFGEGTQVFREIDLVRCYLNRRNPLQQELDPPTEFAYDKWLYVLTNADTAMRQFNPGRPMPHATGRATVNPIFARRKLDDSRVRFDFDFPSVWFAYQNADMFAYHGDRTECEIEMISKIGDEIDEAEIAGLIDRFIVIGMPAKYLRQTGL